MPSLDSTHTNSDAVTQNSGSVPDRVLSQLWGLSTLFGQHGRQVSTTALSGSLSDHDFENSERSLTAVAQEHGFIVKINQRALSDIPAMALPVMLILKENSACILQSYNEDQCKIQLSEFGNKSLLIPTKKLAEFFTGSVWFVKPGKELEAVQHNTYQSHHDEKEAPNKHWLWRVLWKFRATYLESAFASFLINLLALAASMFSMNVYDRVIPNNALSTLWVMAVGVVIAYTFELGLRTLRGYFMDTAARKADLLLSSMLFRQTLALRLEMRPGSAGNFAGQIREFESVRDFFTSATLVAIADLPFIFLFVWVIDIIAGPLVWAVFLAIPLIVIMGVLIQIPLASQSKEHFKVNTGKYGILVETVEGMESLKALGAERYMRHRWESANAHTALTGMKTRVLSAFAVNFTQTVLQLVNVVIIVWGAYLVAEGKMTTGAMIACTMLASRALAPLAQVSGLFARLQQALTSFRSLDKIMQMESERDISRTYLHKSNLTQHIAIRDLQFGYSKDEGVKLSIPELQIRVGERVAILGRIGSGKSTLLKLMAALYKPQKGNLLFDGVDVQQIDPADRRVLIGYLGQSPNLFRGTLRENLLLGNPFIDNEEILRVCRLTGLEQMIAAHSKGFDMPIGERGVGLSGGQQQMIALARMLALRPSIMLLDEPTSALDQRTEQNLIREFKNECIGKTLVVVTHKPAMLDLVDRLIVIEQGRVVVDGPKDSVLTELQRGVSMQQHKETAKENRGVA